LATKDVRVRLSAEGEQSVVNAFRRVQQEAQKSKQSATDATAGFDSLKNAAHSLAVEFLGFEAALKIFEGIKGAVESSIELATTIEKMEQKTGLAADTLQVFAVAAKRLGIEQEAVNKGLGFFAKNMGLLAIGTPKTTEAVHQLFKTTDALKGLTTDQQLIKVTDALGKMAAGGQKAYIATALLGKGGLALIPVMNELADKGFAATKKKLEELGVVMSDDFIANAHRAEESLADLKLASQGLTTQFSSGFLPALSDVVEGLAGAGGKGASAMKEFGKDVGDALKSVVLLFGSIGIGFTTLLEKAQALGKFLNSWHPLDALKQYRAELQAAEDAEVARDKALGELVSDKGNAAVDLLAERARVAKAVAEEAATATAAQEKAAARARAELAKANLDLARAHSAEALEIYKDANRIAVEDEKARWKHGEESVNAYYDHRLALAAQVAAAEKKALGDQIALEEKAHSTTKDPAKRIEIEKTISELKTKASLDEMKATEQQTLLVREREDAYHKLADEILGFEAQVDEARGKGHAKELAAIDREAEKYRTELLQAGQANVEQKVTEFTSVMKAQADFKSAEHDAEQLMRTMEIERKNIELSAKAGLISETEKKRELIKLEHDRIPLLEAQLKLMQQIAQQSGQPELIAQAGEFALKIRETTLETEKLENKSKDVGKVLGQSLGKDMNAFFTRGIFQAKSFGDAMRGLGQSVVASLNQMFTQLIMQMIRAKLQAKLAGAGGGGGGFLGFLSSMAGGASGKAGGGPIRGPGTGTSDSIPIWASDGEYMVRESKARIPEVRSLLDAINFGMSTPPLARPRGPRYAQGGEVTSGGIVLGGERGGAAALTVGLDYGLVIKSLEAHPAFGKVVVRHLSENRKAANSALGR
jgi:hypothetical protein